MDKKGLALGAVAIGWVTLFAVLARWGARLLPRSIAAALTLESYLSIVLVVATALGVAATFAMVPEARTELALDRPGAVHLVVALLCAPIVVVVSAYLGFRLALPTLLDELARGGRQAVERNTGEFGRTLVQAHVVTTLLWAVVLTPIGEELLFRGALWSAVRRIVRRVPRVGPWIATLLTTAIFAWLHADQPGGAGIVRIVQAAVLGFALGCARHATGGIAAPIVLHAAFNLLSIAKLRRWIVSPGWPPPLPIATFYWQLAAAAAGIMALGFALATRFRFRAEVGVHLRIDPTQAAARLADVESNVPPGAESQLIIEAEGDGTEVRWVVTREVRSLPRYLAALARRQTLRSAMRAALERQRD